MKKVGDNDYMVKWHSTSSFKAKAVTFGRDTVTVISWLVNFIVTVKIASMVILFTSKEKRKGMFS